MHRALRNPKLRHMVCMRTVTRPHKHTGTAYKTDSVVNSNLKRESPRTQTIAALVSVFDLSRSLHRPAVRQIVGIPSC